MVIAPCASARVSGSLDWSAGHYDAREAGASVEEADYFSQKYSLWFHSKGRILNGRGGEYQIALGGEWTDFNTDITVAGIQSELEVDTSKVLYEGDFVFAPGGLPFRMHLYSRDMNKARFEYDNNFFSDGSFNELIITEKNGRILTPDIVTDTDDGTQIVTGVSLVLGIRNGSYLGRYRDILSHFPKLFLDYKETYVKDLETFNPSHYKDREMAFVSLNKKHNWLHYRFFDHTDELNPAENEERSMIVLGNINQFMVREWVNLTNWIKISSDGSYVKQVTPNLPSEREKSYSLNFFLKTSQSNWKSNLYSSLTRVEETDSLKREAVIPFFAHGDINRNSSFRTTLIGSMEKENRPFALISQERAENNFYSSTRFDLNKTGKYKLSPVLEVETVNGNWYGNGSAFKAGVAVTTNRKIVKDFHFLTELDFSYISEEDNATLLRDLSYWQITCDNRFTKDLNSRLRYGVEADFSYGSGETTDGVVNYIKARSISGITGNSSGSGSGLYISDSLFRSDITVFVDHVSVNRMKNRIAVTSKYLEFDNENFEQYSLEHRLDYSEKAMSVSILNVLGMGDNLSTSMLGFSGDSTKKMGSYFDGYALNSSALVGYSLSRNWGASLKFIFDMVNSDRANEGGIHYELEQEQLYQKFVVNGRVRKLYSVEQILKYEVFEPELGETSEKWMLAIIGNYYPKIWSRLGAKTRLQQDVETGTLEAGYGLYSDFIFSKLTAGIEYEYGMRTEDDLGLVMDRDEQRWQVNIKKTF